MNNFFRKSYKKLLVSIALIVVLSSCVYDSMDTDGQPVPVDDCNVSGVTFASTIKPLLDARCVECHSTNDPAYGINLETFEGTMEATLDGRLIGSIKHLDGYAPMPKFAPMLQDCDIMKVEQWVRDGALNN